MTEFARKLKRRRLKAGLTQQQLADRIDISLNALQKWEQGRNRPGPRPLRRLAEFYHTTATRLG